MGLLASYSAANEWCASMGTDPASRTPAKMVSRINNLPWGFQFDNAVSVPKVTQYIIARVVVSVYGAVDSFGCGGIGFVPQDRVRARRGNLTPDVSPGIHWGFP